MTYQEVQDRLNKVETALNAFASGNYQDVQLPMSQAQLQELKEQLENQLKVLAEEEGTVSTDDPGEAEKLAKKGVNVQLTKEVEDPSFDLSETRAIGQEVGKALALALRELGDEVSSMKLTNINPGSFKVECTYKGAGGAEFDFYISEDTLFLNDYSYDREIADVGVKPSGEAVVNKDVIKDALVTIFKSMNEVTKGYGEKYPKEKFAKLKGKTVKYYGANYKVVDADEYVLKLQDEDGKTTTVNLNQFKEKGFIAEAPEGLYYIEVSIRDARRALEILDDMYRRQFDINGSNVYYFGDPSLAYDAISDLRARGIEVVDNNIDDLDDMDEAMDINDPILMKLRAAKTAAAKKQADDSMANAIAKNPYNSRKDSLLAKLKAARAQVMRDMEQEAELEGGPIADAYAEKLEKIDAAIAKLTGKGEPTFTLTREGSDEEFEAAKEAERLEKHPERDKIKAIQAMIAREKGLKEWGGSDQHAMNQSMHKNLGEPKEFPGLSQILDAAEIAVDFYWDDWEEYETDREGLIMHAAQIYARKMFPEFMSMAAKFVEPVDEGKYKSDAQRKAVHASKAEKNEEVNEASANKIKKDYDKHVSKMKELAKEYSKAEGDAKEKIKDQLKDMTAKKKQLEKDLDKAVAGTGKDQELDESAKKKVKTESLDRDTLRGVIEEAYIEVLREEGAVLPTGTQELLKKFPTLERNIVNLFTEDHEQFIEAIEWIAPKPTAFKVILKNGQTFILKWMGKSFEAQIMGKRFALDKVSEYQQALDKLHELLKQAPAGTTEEPLDGEAGDLGSGGGGGDFPGEEGGAEGGEEDLDFEEGGEEEVEFEEPGEEPEA